jgi:hypothetical protein
MKTTHALGLTLLLTAALSACTSGSGGAGTPTTTVTSTATATATDTATDTATATTTATDTTTTTTRARATTGARVATGATSGRPGRCVSSVLQASFGRSLGAAGHAYVALLLTNRSHATCTLGGYPGVSFVAAGGHQIGAPAQRDSRFAAVPVTLAPGAIVHATVDVADYANYDPQTCLPVRATGFRIFPPGSTGSLLISAPQTVCSRSGVQQFQTSVMRTGTSPD